jgi:hypothetical protein
MHGGSRRVKYRALYRATEASCLREFEAAKVQWREDMVKWQVERITVTSNLLGIPAGRVTQADILTYLVIYGVPAKPKPVMRRDRRYGRRPR